MLDFFWNSIAVQAWPGWVEAGVVEVWEINPKAGEQVRIVRGFGMAYGSEQEAVAPLVATGNAVCGEKMMILDYLLRRISAEVVDIGQHTTEQKRVQPTMAPAVGNTRQEP